MRGAGMCFYAVGGTIAGQALPDKKGEEIEKSPPLARC